MFAAAFVTPLPTLSRWERAQEPLHSIGWRASLVRGRGEAVGIGGTQRGPKFAQQTLGKPFHRAKREERAEPACKPGSVVDSHSSRRIVADTLEQPTRTRRGPRHEVPIWPCSRWGLPCRSVTGLAVRSYRTISPLPDPRRAIGGLLSVALSVGSRRPGVTWHRALWSPDFPRRACARRGCLTDSAAGDCVRTGGRGWAGVGRPERPESQNLRRFMG